MGSNKKIVLDTSIFVNPDSRYLFGKSPQQALDNFLKGLEKKKSITCYVPPSVYDELINFIDDMPALQKTFRIKMKPPSSYQDSLPALFLYEFIDESRIRINKGLRISEKYTRKGTSEKNKEEKELVQALRQEYRAALREGILDSKADFDAILLSKELNAYLATSDNGLIKWARKLGIVCLSAKELHMIIV